MDMFFSVYIFECYNLLELCRLVVKAVRKLAYKQVLIAICTKSIASKQSKGLSRFIFFFYWTLLLFYHINISKHKPNRINVLWTT